MVLLLWRSSLWALSLCSATQAANEPEYQPAQTERKLKGGKTPMPWALVSIIFVAIVIWCFVHGVGR